MTLTSTAQQQLQNYACKMGEIEPFNPDLDSWSEWEERFVLFLESKQITDDAVKRARLLTACGKKAYSLFRSLVAPAKLCEKSFSDLLEMI